MFTENLGKLQLLVVMALVLLVAAWVVPSMAQNSMDVNYDHPVEGVDNELWSRKYIRY